jgi:Asp-tRNA(Asn)/Glu-tRNA(Gln) amidotransferase A subunit family amidase
VGGKTVPARHVLRATLPWDITGSPALAMAFEWSEDRLPIAIQLIGRHYDEATVLSVGLALESASQVLGQRARACNRLRCFSDEDTPRSTSRVSDRVAPRHR